MSPDWHAEELKDLQYLQAPNETEHNKFDTNEDVEYVEVGGKKNVFKHILTYMMHSSLFIFHREWKLRKWCIALVVSPETHQEFINKRNEDRAAITELTLQNNDDLENEMSDMEDSKDENGNKLDKNTKLRLSERKNALYPLNNTKSKVMRHSEIYKLIKFNPKTTHPSKYFDYTVIILILLSSLLLIADNPLNDPDSTYSKVLEIIDFVFTFLFLIEAIIKIIALGFFYSSIPANAYIMSGWNILDFIVVTASMVDFIVLIQNSSSVDTSQLQSLKALRGSESSTSFKNDLKKWRHEASSQCPVCINPIHD